MKKIIMNVATREKRVAVLENDKVIELHIQQPNHEEIVGNIYNGRVIDVLPGMQAAFIDIGIGKNGYIHRDQLLRYQISPLPEKEKRNKSISSFVHQGEEIVVQVLKDGTDRKGPKLTGIIEIPGKHVIYVPHGNYIAVSRKMRLEAEREKWREFGQSTCQKPEGLIFRTACESQCENAVLEEIAYSREKFQEIIKRKMQGNTPCILFEANDIVEKIMFEHSQKEITEMIIDDSQVYRLIKGRFGNDESKISLYTEKENIFSFLDIERDVDRTLKQIVWLQNGSYIIIEQTEALTTIDVNTGKFLGKESHKETVLQTNLVAAKEIAHQLRLRDVSGIILVDFIDMRDERDRQKVINAFRGVAKSDRNRVQVHGFTMLGILEITRKRVRQSIPSRLQMSCPTCSGTGVVESSETIAFKLERELWELRGIEHEALWIEATKEVISVFKGQHGEHVKRLEDALSIRLLITEVDNILPCYTLRHMGTINEIENRIKLYSTKA